MGVDDRQHVEWSKGPPTPKCAHRWSILLLAVAVGCQSTQPSLEDGAESEDYGPQWYAHWQVGSASRELDVRPMGEDRFLGVDDWTEESVLVMPLDASTGVRGFQYAFYMMDTRRPCPGEVQLDDEGEVSDDTDLLTSFRLTYFGMGERTRVLGEPVIGGVGVQTDVCGPERALRRWMEADSAQLNGWALRQR